jgi:hypothetical protein
MTEDGIIEFKGSANKLIDQSSRDAFAVIEELNKISLISPTEVATLQKAQVFLMSTYTDVPVFRTYMEKYVGVLTNSRFSTPDAKFWQCKKEAEVQFSELLKAMLRHKALNVDIEECGYKLNDLAKKKGSAEHPFLVECDLSRLEIKMAEIKLHLKAVEKEIKYRIVEIGDWNDISKEWEDSMKHSKVDYEQHEVDSMQQYLNREIAAAVAKSDDKSAKILTAQLDTLKGFIKKKMETLLAGRLNRPAPDVH